MGLSPDLTLEYPNGALKEMFRKEKINLLAIACLFCAPMNGARLAGHSLRQPSSNVTDVAGVIDRLRFVLGSQNRGVVIELRGACQLNTETIEVPIAVRVSGVKQANSLATVKDILSEDGNLSVVQVPSGSVEVRNVAVSKALLDTRITNLRLTALQRRYPNEAIAALLNYSDVQTAFTKLAIRPSIQLAGVEYTPVDKSLRLPKSLANTTVEGVISSILKTFGGFVVYEECSVASGRETIFSLTYYN